MTRSVSVKFGGKNVELVASFGAARDISKHVHDLLDLYNDQQRTMIFLQMGREYKPKFTFDMDSVAQIFETAFTHSKVEASRDDVDAFMVEIGLDKAQAAAQDYLALFFAEPETKPEEAVAEADEDAKPGK